MIRSYIDISVYVAPAPEDDESYSVRVESSSGGQGNSTFKIPFKLGDLTDVVFGVDSEQVSQSPVDPQSKDPQESIQATPKTAADYGTQLFDALFQDTARDVLIKTWGETQGDNTVGVRIRLSMNLQTPRMAEVACLPWELMCRKDQHPFALSSQTPFVRAFDTPHSMELKPLKLPLRILALKSNPQGSEELDLSEESAILENEWASLPGVKVDFVRPIRSEILDQLRKYDYHAVHYMGHGDFDPSSGGQLLLEKEDGSADYVSAEDFAIMLHDEPLRLVFLNACKSGSTNENSSVHPFAGVATALINDGVPAVLAMQFPISDQAAIVFAKTFYECITNGYYVDVAVTEGRKMLKFSEYSEWATPVLYLRTSDGQLFEALDTDDAKVDAMPVDAMPVDAKSNVSTTEVPEIDDPWNAAGEDVIRVFLATTDQNLGKLHRQLSKQLSTLDWVRVIDEVPTDDLLEHAEFIDKITRNADICIHLLGANPGERIDDDAPAGTLDTFPLKQLDTAYELSRAQLVIMTKQDRDSIANENYANFVKDLSERPRSSKKLEFAITDKLKMQQLVVAKLEKLRDSRLSTLTSDPVGKQAFVDSHEADADPAFELVAYLENREVEAKLRTTDGNSGTDFSELQDIVKDTSLYIIVSGNVDRSWAINRRMVVQKAATRARNPIVIAKYSKDPEASNSTTSASTSVAPIEIVSRLFDPDSGWIEALSNDELENRE